MNDARQERFARFMKPQSVAIVGASERQQRSNNAMKAMADSGIRLYFVNPHRDHVYGQKSCASLADVPEVVDAVLSLVPADSVIHTVTEASTLGVGGVVVIAGDFSEAGAEGAALERQLFEAAGDMPVLGPNCNGFVRPAAGARLSGAPLLPFPGGTVGAITHSGALLGAFGLAAQERLIGFSSLISTGNEMNVDMADCLEFLADDPDTHCIALVIETIRAPERFFAAARRAVAKGKPIVALKLGRSQRGQAIANSHTGALAGRASTYDAAFRQLGIAVASDLVDLMDRLALVAQLDPGKWNAVEGLAVASLSGGWAALTSDVCADEGVPLPELTELRTAINAVLPERTIVNPLDMTGFAMGKADVVGDVLSVFADSDAVDVVMLQWFVDESAGESATTFVEAALSCAALSDKPVIISSIEDGHPGSWARDLPAQGVAVGRGIRATARGIRTMADHMRNREQLAHQQQPAQIEVVPFPAAATPVPSVAGRLLPFDVAMEVLRKAGVPVAPYLIVEPAAPVPAFFGFPGPYVAKLADVPHRSDIGAVRLDLSGEALPAAIADLKLVATQVGAPARVVVQPFRAIHGEAFVGAVADTELGPMVMFGAGGIFVELLGLVARRIAPLNDHDVNGMLDEITMTGVFDGARGQARWDRGQLAHIVRAINDLIIGGRGWIESIDINPLGLTDDGFIAVDALIFVKAMKED